jgi:hypothetical protein
VGHDTGRLLKKSFAACFPFIRTSLMCTSRTPYLMRTSQTRLLGSTSFRLVSSAPLGVLGSTSFRLVLCNLPRSGRELEERGRKRPTLLKGAARLYKKGFSAPC